MTGSPPGLDGNGIDELRRLLIEALERIAALTAENAALREEIARNRGKTAGTAIWYAIGGEDARSGATD
jgi:hypothetical protein